MQQQIFQSSLLSSPIPAFLSKTKSMLINPEYEAIISWDQEGKILKIHNMKQMERKILPKQFRHCNYNSFVRQLNMYGFKKMKRRLHGVAFAHPLFLRDDVEETLMLIKRRRNILKKQNKVTSEDQTISDSSDKLQKNISNVVEENCNHETALSYVQNMNVKQFYQPQQIFEPFLSFQNYQRQNQMNYQWLVPFFPMYA